MSTAKLGGKATNLIYLKENGFNVPAFWVIDPEQFEALKGLDDEERNQRIQYSLQEHGLESTDYFAVRSSADAEDGSALSFAGLFETQLYIDIDSLWKAIVEVQESTHSDRVREYVKKHGLPEIQHISIIVQKMVPSEVSGVAFGANPMNSNRNERVVNSVFGLGEGLVSGRISSDQYIKINTRWEGEIADKQEELVYENRVLEYVSLEERSRQSTLSDDQLNEIDEVLAKLDKLYGQPQDIEFAFAKGEFYLLQTRPITTLEVGEYTLWDNSNIVESYPGITTPLTFTFIEVMYDQAYRQLVSLMGVTDHQIQKHREVFANTLGLVRGRVYYNLLSWYKMLAMVPGYSLNAEFMENMMGVKERFELKEDLQVSKGTARIRLVWMVFRMIALQFTLPGKRRRFQAHLNKTMNAYSQLDFKSMSDTEIVGHYKTFEQTLLTEWKAPLINDFFSMIWFGLLKKFCEKHLPNEANVHNDLLCGSEDIISVEPIHRSLELAAQVRRDAAAKQLFIDRSPVEIWSALEDGAHPEIRSSIQSYIDRFGERCVGELKLETISYSQDPTLFVRVIKSYIEHDVSSDLLEGRIHDQLREKAEAKMKSALRGKPIERWKYKLLLKQARAHVSSRENLRFERTRGFGMVRKMFTALGEFWAQQGILKNARDVFYLELDEITGIAVESDDIKSKFTPTFSDRVQARKAEFAKFAEQEIPAERFSTFGRDFSDARIFSTEKLEDPQTTLQGIGCCPGQVRAKAAVISSPDEIDSLKGDILITSSTDPGWVTLFPSASAIIVERGSLLSHSAIVSREMGIPCIVGVTGLLRSVSSGDEIWMDGSTGEIQVTKHE